VAGLCKNSPEQVLVSFTPGRFLVTADKFRYAGPLTNYERKLPWRNNDLYTPIEDYLGTLDVEMFLQAVQRACACLRSDKEAQGSLGVKITLRDNVARVVGTASTGESVVSCPLSDCPVANEEVAFKVGGLFLMRHLRAMGGGPVKLVVNKKRTGLVLRHELQTVCIALMT
jgi:hypothetical protein